jgi:hypothetical protein
VTFVTASNVTPGDGFLDGGKAVRDVVRLLEGGELFGAGVDPGDEGDAGDCREGFGMVPRHAAGAQDKDADGLHQRYPASPS